MTAKENSREQNQAYDPKDLFLLSTEEQLVYDRLSLPEKTLFSLFRQTFILSSGSAAAQGEILAALMHEVGQATQVVFAAHDELPEFLTVIRAPLFHNKYGKFSANKAEDDVKRVTPLKESWEIWKSKFALYTNGTQSKSQQIADSLLSFLYRDDEFVNAAEANRRSTGNKRHASFFREYILDSTHHDKFDPHITRLITKWNELLTPFLNFQKQYLLETSKTEFSAFAEWYLIFTDPAAESKAVAMQQIPELVTQFHTAFGHYPTFQEGQMIECLFDLKNHWDEQNPGQSFLK